MKYIKKFKLLNLPNKGNVGLMGGSFNPPHLGHLKIAELAIKKLKLDKLIWLVTPQNPLKSPRDLLPLHERVDLCQSITNHNPKIVISDIESDLGSTYSYDTITSIKKLITPSINLVWIMGEDLWYNFNKFYKWQSICDTIPILVMARNVDNNNTPSFKSLLQKTSVVLRKHYIQPNMMGNLPYLKPPCWSFYAIPKINISSTEIRKQWRK